MKKKKEERKAKVHKDLQGFDVSINSFGEINRSFDIDKLNTFLSKNVKDKKLIKR